MKPSQHITDELVKIYGEERVQTMVTSFEKNVQPRLIEAWPEDQVMMNFAFITFCHGFTEGVKEGLTRLREML